MTIEDEVSDLKRQARDIEEALRILRQPKSIATRVKLMVEVFT